MKSAAEKRVKELEARILMLETRIAELEARVPNKMIYPNSPGSGGTSPYNPFPNIWYNWTTGVAS